MIYLGTPGRMVGIKCPVSQRVDYSERYSFATTLEGRRKAQVLPQQRRVWDVNTGNLTSPSQVADLMAFADGSWGPGPFWFIPTDGPVTNLLSPAAASSDVSSMYAGAGLQGGPWDTPEGLVPRSILNTGPYNYWGTSVPVVPGRPVSGSVMVSGSGGFLRLWWLNATGGEVSTTSSRALSGAGPERLSVTAVPPAGAAQVRLGISPLVIRAARPQVTFGAEVYEWSDGQGCEQAVVHAVSRDVVRAGARQNDRWSNVGFTVTEVG